MNDKTEFPFKEGDTYWIIEEGTIIKSCWDDVSETLFIERVENDEDFVFGIEEYYFNSEQEAKYYLFLKQFPNGFESWYEVHHEIVAEISKQNLSDEPCEIILNVVSVEGIGGLYELGKDLTFKFENQYKGIIWGEELDFFETIELFTKKEIYGEKE